MKNLTEIMSVLFSTVTEILYLYQHS